MDFLGNQSWVSLLCTKTAVTLKSTRWQHLPCANELVSGDGSIVLLGLGNSCGRLDFPLPHKQVVSPAFRAVVAWPASTHKQPHVQLQFLPAQQHQHHKVTAPNPRQHLPPYRFPAISDCVGSLFRHTGVTSTFTAGRASACRCNGWQYTISPAACTPQVAPCTPLLPSTTATPLLL
jgi:hypothetical protein